MKVPYSWFKEFIPELPSVDELVTLLDGLGLAVEEVETLPAAPDGVVVAEVRAVRDIEGSDHLKETEVFDGQRTHQVVCGAPNVRLGLRTALAKPGTNLPGAGFEVGVREMAGVKSEGVLCSPRELGLYDYAAGLMVLGDDAELGAEFAPLWPKETVIELELTPNRADAFSLLGVARDLAAKLDVPYHYPATGLEPGEATLEDGLKLEIEDTEACPRFTLQLIENVTVKPSPIWLQRRLAALGLRPRNNIVDITNYVTFELGQPSHAYDRADLTDGTIVVRRAQAGERLTALNEEALEFSGEDLLITTPDGDGTLPIGVAGVIGGLHHSVKAGTNNVALEVAHFDPVTVRRTAKRLGLSTDAHYRFERGVDPNLPPLASARAAQLIAELAGGTVHPGFTEVGEDKPLSVIPFRPSRVAFLMAIEVPLETQRRYLERLGCRVEVVGEDDWRVTAPSWRFDMEIEEDLIEEVSRLHGFEHVGVSVPAMHFIPEGRDHTHRALRDLLVGMGLTETISYVFTSDGELSRASAPAASVKLQSPPSAERSVLRPALYPGLLQAAQVNHAEETLALFEIGRVFAGEERERLGVLARGNWSGGGWLPPQTLDFYVFKGIFEKLAATLRARFELRPEKVAHLHPGVSAALIWNGREIGTLGRLHPEVAARYELGEVYLAELELPLEGSSISFQDIQRQPHAERDLAIIVPSEVPYASLKEIVMDSAGSRLEAIWPFDVFAGQKLGEGKKSVAVRLRFRYPDRALRDEEVDADMTNIISALQEAGYAIRDS